MTAPVSGEVSSEQQTGAVNWRDSFGVWPYLAVTIKILPWSWRFGCRGKWDRKQGGYADFYLWLGPLQIDYGHNHGGFPVERTAKGSSDGV